MRKVIKVYRNCCLTEEFDVFDTDLLVFDSLLLSLRGYHKGLAELIHAAFLSRFINLHQNDLFKGQMRLIVTFNHFFELRVIDFG